MRAMAVAGLLGLPGLLWAGPVESHWMEVPLYVARDLPTDGDNERYAKVVPDGAGGAFLVWVASDAFDPALQVYGQRVAADGSKRWNRSDPLVLAADPARDLSNLGVASDGSGGLLVAYQALAPGAASGPTWIQRFDGEGRPCWPQPVELAGAADAYFLGGAGDGGAVALGVRRSGGLETVFASRVDGAGTLVYRKDLYRTRPGTSIYPANLAVAGARPGEMRFVVADRHGAGREPAVFALRLGPDGALSERRISAGPAGLDPAGPCVRLVAAAPDGAGGAYAAWVALGGGRRTVRLTRLGPDGRPTGEFPAGGLAVDDDPKTEKFNLTVARDGAGGALVQYAARPAGSLERPCARSEAASRASGRSWCDERLGYDDCAGTGAAAFASDLWLARVSPRRPQAPLFLRRVARGITSDAHEVLAGVGGFSSSWVDEATRDVLAQRLDVGGAALFAAARTIGSYRTRGSLGITLLPGPDGDVVIAWKEGSRLYAQSLAAAAP